MVLADDEGQYIDANDSAVELFGLPETELLGHSIKDFTPEGFDFEAAWQGFQASESERGTFSLVRHDGTELVVEYAATRNVVPGQHLSVLRDVTDAQNYEQVIERLHDTAQEIFSADSEKQVAMIMITAIEDILELPINGVAMYDDSEEVLRTIAATERATELVGDLPVFHPGESLAWDVFETGQIAHYEDVSTAPNRHNSETPIRSEVVVPLGEYGVFTCGATTEGAFEHADVALLELLAAAIRLAQGQSVDSDAESRLSASGFAVAGSREGVDRLAATSRTTLEKLDDALADIQTAAAGGAPDNPEAERLLEQARRLRAEVDDRLAEIEAAERAEPEKADEPAGDAVDVDAELASLKEDVDSDEDDGETHNDT
jgi:PAS domain S-box-containing protein